MWCRWDSISGYSPFLGVTPSPRHRLRRLPGKYRRAIRREVHAFIAATVAVPEPVAAELAINADFLSVLLVNKPEALVRVAHGECRWRLQRQHHALRIDRARHKFADQALAADIVDDEMLAVELGDFCLR